MYCNISKLEMCVDPCLIVWNVGSYPDSRWIVIGYGFVMVGWVGVVC